MAINQKLEKLATEKNTPCGTISLNTHRTHPDNIQDSILLKNLLKEAEDRVINEHGKRPVASLLEKLSVIESEIDVNYNIDSLHIFLSNDTKEIIKSTLPLNILAISEIRSSLSKSQYQIFKKVYYICGMIAHKINRRCCMHSVVNNL